MSSSKERAEEMKKQLQGKMKTTPEETEETAPPEEPAPRDPRGRKKRADSKRSLLADGVLSKMSVLIPSEIHRELAVMAARDKTIDMSDIVTEILQKHIKVKK